MFWTYAMVIVNFNRNPILPKKVTPSYYFEYLSLKNMNFMGSGLLCLFWEGAGVSKNTSFLRTTLFKGYRTMVFRPLTNELMLSFLHKLKTYNV